MLLLWVLFWLLFMLCIVCLVTAFVFWFVVMRWFASEALLFVFGFCVVLLYFVWCLGLGLVGLILICLIGSLFCLHWILVWMLFVCVLIAFVLAFWFDCRIRLLDCLVLLCCLGFALRFNVFGFLVICYAWIRLWLILFEVLTGFFGVVGCLIALLFGWLLAR